MIGRTLGPYRIVDKLGAGGMGEVYSARDTRLDRTVAIKVLPERIAGNREARERFEREARSISSLNHPNICALHDVGHEQGIDFLVMELVAGETLEARLTRGPLPLEEALPIARQVATALEAAHEAGIIHRDLKPSNIKLRDDGNVKVLDFGLAKATSGSTPREGGSLATITSPAMTQAGMILGTAAYMSPEQARGRQVDKRADIWAFGCVLYEMLAGRRAFAPPAADEAAECDSVTDILAAIVTREPEWNALPSNTPREVHRLLRRCLEKDARRRLRDIGDAVIEIDDASSDRAEVAIATAQRKTAPSAVLAIVGLLAMVTAFVAGWFSAPARSATPPRTWEGEMFAGPATALQPAISPDGQTLAFQAMTDGNTQVAVMNTNRVGWRVLTTDRTRGSVSSLAWARDGSRIFFDRVSHSVEGIFSVSLFGEDARLVLEGAMAPRPLKDGSLLVVTNVLDNQHARLHRFWPGTTPRRLEPLNAILSARLLDAALQVFPDDREVVFYGRPADTPDAVDDLYVIDLASGVARKLAPRVGMPTPTWRLPLAVTNERVFISIPAGDLHPIIAIPRRDASPEAIETMTTLSQRPLNLAVGENDAIYSDQLAQPYELVWYSSATRRVDERQPLGLHVASVSIPAFPLADGRVLMVGGVPGRERIMVLARGRTPAPLVDTAEVRPPVALLGKDRVILVAGNGPAQRLAIVSLADGRIQSTVDGVDVTRVVSLAGSADGRWIFFGTQDGQIWRIAPGGGQAQHFQSGGLGAVDPLGQYVVIQQGDGNSTRLARVPIEGGTATQIPISGEWRSSPGGLSPFSVGSDGRIVLRIASKGTWYWPIGILDPRSGAVEIVDLGPDLDAGGGWMPDGRILATANKTLSTLWRFRPQVSSLAK